MSLLLASGAWANCLKQGGGSQVLPGSRIRPSIKPTEIPDDYKPYKIALNGEPSAADQIAQQLAVYVATGVANLSNSADPAVTVGLARLWELCWTNGETTDQDGRSYLVAYRLDTPLVVLLRSGGRPITPSPVLRLTLIRSDQIVLFSPDSSITKRDLFRALGIPLTQLRPTTAPAPGTENAGPPTNTVANPPATNVTKPSTQPKPGPPQNALFAKRREEMSKRLKQLNAAMTMYLAETNDLYPYPQSNMTMRNLMKRLVPSPDLWFSINPKEAKVLFNLAVGGVKVVDIPAPETMPVFYETAAWPDGYRTVAFADGSVRAVHESEWALLEPNLKAKLKKSAKPLPADYLIDK